MMADKENNDIFKATLPVPVPDPKSIFGVDQNINITTIDNYLGRCDAVYRDMRMLFDPADYAAIGGNAELSSTIRGFRIVPYPYLATLPQLPVKGAYSGKTLFSLMWDKKGDITSAKTNYLESQTVLEDLFPRDKAIFLMCGGGGYAGMTLALLAYLGWNRKKLYNIGGAWSYAGSNGVQIIQYAKDADGIDLYATWRADYAYIDFAHLNPAD